MEVFKIVNGYEDIDKNMFFKLKEVTLVKEQCRLDMRKYSFSQRTINGTDFQMVVLMLVVCIMFKYRIDMYLIRAGYT